MIHDDGKRNAFGRYGFRLFFGADGKNKQYRQKAGKKDKNMKSVNFKYHYNHPAIMYMTIMGRFCSICSSISVDLKMELLYNIILFCFSLVLRYKYDRQFTI